MRLNEPALRSLQSPALSLFNRLGALVHTLQPMKDFFAQWPRQVCMHIRSGTPLSSGRGRVIGPQMSFERPTMTSSGGGECWNGKDFTG